MNFILKLSLVFSCTMFSGFITFAAQSFDANKGMKKPVRNEISESAKAEAALYKELTGKDYSKLDETSLYSEIITSFQSQNETEFSAMLTVFMQKYSQSIYADNALFLAGKMALEKKQYGRAVTYFQKIQDQFPQSNKVVSASFAKGVAYKKMNLEKLALRVFDEVSRKYPGSPESFRAGNEAKLIRSN
ncbi:MAG: tetratricopeptide repeat protein [Pseudobdellovibrionaceae bacterium]